ncbi:MAG: M42 family metallopeptidase [Candidatus Heteroscillospira sp.]|jgi:putative aminopeptidase FrvX
MELKKLISELCSLTGPSGFEDKIMRRCAELLAPYTDEMHTDAMGNLIAVRRCGKPGAKTLMLDAHMDEIGFIVTGYDKGFLRFANIGGVDPRMLPALEVRVLTPEPMYGVIDILPPHVLDAEDRDKTIDAKKLCIDVGLSREEAEARIPLGTPVSFAGGCRELGENVLCGKTMDDRACLAVIIKAMEMLSGCELDVDVAVLVAVQEEVGLRGAVTGAYSVAPDYAITLDVTHAYTPDAKKSETVKFGGGAAIAKGPNMNRAITEAVISAADKRGIAYQIEVVPGQSGTNAWAIQVSRAGVATALISVPLKYMHTPVETLDVHDAQSAADILAAYITGMEGEENA